MLFATSVLLHVVLCVLALNMPLYNYRGPLWFLCLHLVSRGGGGRAPGPAPPLSATALIPTGRAEGEGGRRPYTGDPRVA